MASALQMLHLLVMRQSYRPHYASCSSVRLSVRHE